MKDKKGNSGDYNSGYSNSGDYNSGNCNSGNCNSGGYNSGDYNSGGYNSGDYNSGGYNSGGYNSGYRNSGYYNSGNYNVGLFNTNEPTVRLFNKDTGLKRSEIDVPYIDLKLTEWKDGKLVTRTYKEAWALYWEGASLKDRLRFYQLPNFNASIFKEITGIEIDVQEILNYLLTSSSTEE